MLDNDNIETGFAKQYPCRFLIAEDGRFNQMIIQQILAKMGYTEVQFAATGQAVLEALKTEHFDIILMDIHMPEMGGIEATQHIIKTYPNKRPTIIALTSSLSKDKCLAYLDQGMDDHTSKPVSIKSLHTLIKKWISSSP